MSCPQRKHRWQSNPPVAGTVCIKCGKVFQGVPGFVHPAQGGQGNSPPVPAVPAPPPPPGDRAARVAAAFAAMKAPPPVMPDEVIGPGERDELPPGEPNGWQRGAAKKLRRIFFGALDAGIEMTGRKPGEPEDDDEEDVEEAFARSLASWFPDGALSPTKDLLLATSFAAASVWASSKKIDQSGAPRPAPAAPAAGTQAPAPAPERPAAPAPAAIARNVKALAVFDGG